MPSRITVRRLTSVLTHSPASRLGATPRPAQRAGGLDAVCARADQAVIGEPGASRIASSKDQDKEDHHDRHCENHPK
jgi:hypothetical protein